MSNRNDSRFWTVSRGDLKYLSIILWILAALMLLNNLGVLLHGGLERDFAYFYSVGYILNEHPPAQLYDYELQKRVLTQLQPIRTGMYGPNPYPPFVALLFRPFARLPFENAYRVWAAVTLVLYLAGLSLLALRFCRSDRLKQSLLFAFALCFPPFSRGALRAGQLSGIAFFAMTLAICLDDSGYAYLSGLALSACAYKPTLLVLILPMLLVIRRYKTLVGFLTGVTSLAVFTTAIEGFVVWPGWIHTIVGFPGYRRPHPYLYVDLNTTASMIAHGASVVRIGILCLGLIMGISLLREWYAFRVNASQRSAALLWGATLTWTLVLNIYVPHYDSILVIISLVVMETAPRPARVMPRRLAAILLLPVAFVTYSSAESTGIQLLTFSLVSIGLFDLAVLRRYRSGLQVDVRQESSSLLVPVTGMP